MPEQKYKYTVDLEVNAKTLKNSIKNEMANAVKEADKIGDALSKGLSPDTKDFENRLTSLEKQMGKLVTETDNVKDVVTSMKTAFKDFEQLKATMQVIGEQNKQMYEMFVNMTPYLHEFANTFTSMKPDQAVAAMAKVMTQMSASGQAGSQAFQDMQKAVEQAGQKAKEKTHEVVVDTKKAADALKEFNRLNDLRKTYNSNKNYKGLNQQESLRTEIESQKKIYEELQKSFSDLTEEDSNYNQVLASTIEAGQKLLALWDKLDNANPRSSVLKSQTFFEDVKEDMQYYLEEYKNAINTISTQAQESKVELKPLKLKVTVEDEAVIKSINKSIERIAKDIKPLKIPLAFYSADKEEAKIDKQIQELLKAENVDQEELARLRKEKAAYEEMQDEKVLTSLTKRVKRITDIFDQVSEPLSTKIQNFKNNIADALTLQFKWNKTDDNGELNGLFSFIQEEAYANPIALVPAEEETINNIQNLLNKHKFNITLEGQAAINGVVSNIGNSTSPINGAPIYLNKSPIYIENGNIIPSGNVSETPMVQIPAGSTYLPPSAKIPTPPSQPSSSQNHTSPQPLDGKAVQHNSNVVDENTEIIRSVVDMFQTWLERTRSSSEKDALASIGMDFRGLKGDELFSFFKNLLYNTPNLGNRLSSVKNGTSPTAIRLFNNEFVEAIVAAQKQLGVQIATNRVTDNSLINQQYFEHYKLLVRIGQSLNSAKVDMERQTIPYQKPLQKLIDLLDNNDVFKDWKKKILEDAKLEVEQARADVKNAPQKVQEAKVQKDEADAYALKREKAATEAKTAYESAERAYNEARQALEGAEKTGDQKKIDSAKAQVKDAETKKNSAYSIFKDAERSAQIAQERANNANATFQDAVTKAERAKVAAGVAEEKLQKAKLLSNNNTVFENVSMVAKDLISKMQELTTKYAAGVDGGITKYLSNLDSDIILQRDRVNNASLSNTDRTTAQQKLDELTSLRDSIFNELKPFVENFEQAKQEIIGDIANLAGNYKFEVIFKDKNGKEKTYSFNNAVEGADKESGPGWYKIVQMLNEIPSMDQILSIRTIKNPNMGDMRLMYGDTMTQAEAVNSVIEAYQRLDDVTKEFLNKIMVYTSNDKDIVGKFLGDEMSVKDKFDLIRKSFLGDDGKISNSLLLDPLNPAKGSSAKAITEAGYEIIRNKTGFTKDDMENLNSIKSKAVQDFGNVVADAIEKATSERRTRKGKQTQMARNTEKPSGVSIKEKQIPASQREFSYSAQDKAYRTEITYTPPSVENVQQQLDRNATELAQATATLENYQNSLTQAEQSHKQEKEKLDTTNSRKELQKQYSDIKDTQSFQVQYNMAEQEARIRQDMISENEKKTQDVTKNINELNAELNKTETSISNIQTRMNDVDNAGGVQKYLEQLNKGIQDSEVLVTRLRDANENFDMRLKDLDFDYERGNIPKEEYELRKQEIEEIVAENNAEIKSEQEKYIKLKEIRRSFLQEITAVDRETGTTYQLSDQEYKNKKTAELQQQQVRASDIRAEITQSEGILADINSKLQKEKAQLDAEQKNLEQMRIAFAEYYYEYVNKLLSETNAEISKIQNAQKIGKLKDLGLDNDSAAQKLNELGNQQRNYSAESERIGQILQPKTGAESDIDFLGKKIEEAKKEVERLEAEKQDLEKRMTALQDGSLVTKAPAPVESMSDEKKKLNVTREVEVINENIKLADAKISEAEREMATIQRKITTLTGKNANKSQLVRNAKGQKTIKAMQFLEKNDTEYQALKTHEEKLDYARNFKERDTSGEYQVDAQKLLEIERRKLQVQKEAKAVAEQKKQEFIAEKQAALDILGITEDQLFAQERLVEKKKEEAEAERQAMQTQQQTPQRQELEPAPTLQLPENNPQQVQSRADSQSRQINEAFLREIDARVEENDRELAELRSKIDGTSGSGNISVPSDTNTKFASYYSKFGTNRIDQNVDRANKEFYDTLKQGAPNKKGKTYVDFSDAGNINSIIAKAKELRTELAAMHKESKEGSKEYITVQRQLSKLLDTTRKGISRTDLANGYEKNQNGTMSKKAWTRFLTDHNGEDLTEFIGSKTNVDDDSKFKNTVKNILTEKINGFTDQYQAAAVQAYNNAFDTKKAELFGSGKSSGNIIALAHRAGQKAFEEFIRKGSQGLAQGVTDTDVAKKELLEEISDIEEENKDLRDLRERYIKGMLVGTEEDNNLLITSFLENPEDAWGMVQQATTEAGSQIDQAGKTKEQIDQETEELFKKILFKMLTAVISGAEEGIDEVEDAFNDKVPSSDNNTSLPSASSNPPSGNSAYYTNGGYIPVDGFAIQANNVIVNGNSINPPNGENSAGPWALETTLQKTNEILNDINQKINGVKDTKEEPKPKKEEKKVELTAAQAKEKIQEKLQERYKNDKIESVISATTDNELTNTFTYTVTKANKETERLTFGINKLGEAVLLSSTKMVNFNNVANKAYDELNQFKELDKDGGLLKSDVFTGENVTQQAKDAAEKYKEATEALSQAMTSAGENSDFVTQEVADNIKRLSENAIKARKNVESIVKQSEALNQTRENRNNFIGSEKDYRVASSEYAKKNFPDFNSIGSTFDTKSLKLTETLMNAITGETVTLVTNVNKLDGAFETTYSKANKFGNAFKKAFAEINSYSNQETGIKFNYLDNADLNFPIDKVATYKATCEALIAKITELKNKGITTPEDAQEVQRLTEKANGLRTEIENIIKSSEKIANSGTLIKKFDAGEVDNVKASMQALAKEIPNASLATSSFNDKTNELTFTVKSGKDEITTLTYKFDELTNSVYETGRASKTTTGFFKGLLSDVGSKVQELTRYYAGMSLITQSLQQVRRGVQYVREIDLALTELKKVTDETDASYTKFLQDMSKTAGIVGSTTSELTTMAAEWGRLGYSLAESAKLAESTAILLNVSEFENATDASEALISTMQAFQYTADESLHVVDILNEVGKYIAQDI